MKTEQNTLDYELKYRKVLDGFFGRMHPNFRLKEKPRIPEIAIHPHEEGLDIRGGAVLSDNRLVLTENPEEIMKYTCIHEGSHFLHMYAYPKLSLWHRDLNSDEKAMLVREVIADLSSLLYLKGSRDFNRYKELAKENCDGKYFQYVMKEIKRGENRLKNLANMHPERAYRSIVGDK